jgi:hypothetical protein
MKFRQEERLWEEHRVNNFIMKLSGRTPAASGGGIADCASHASVLASASASEFTAPPPDGGCLNPAWMRVDKAH